jgi:hypothetical protein
LNFSEKHFVSGMKKRIHSKRVEVSQVAGDSRDVNGHIRKCSITDAGLEVIK